MKKTAWMVIAFCILAVSLPGRPPTITLLSPQGGENWVLGTQHAIAWSTLKGISGTLYINLWGYNRAGQLIHLGPIAEVDYRTGSYLWKAGEYAGKRAGVGKYHIRIRVWYTSQNYMETWNRNFFRLHAFALPNTLAR